MIIGASGAIHVCAQTYPAAPVRALVPFGAGGGSDLAAHTMARELSETLNQPFVVENRPGAGALIGAEAPANATPDGHTIMISTSSWLSSAALSRQPGFDPLKDIVPIVEFAYNIFVPAIGRQLAGPVLR